jgi:hypothetical protein
MRRVLISILIGIACGLAVAEVVQTKEVTVDAPPGWRFVPGRSDHLLTWKSPDRSIEVTVNARRLAGIRADNLEKVTQNILNLELQQTQEVAARNRLTVKSLEHKMGQDGADWHFEVFIELTDGQRLRTYGTVRPGAYIGIHAESKSKTMEQLWSAIQSFIPRVTQ